MPRRQPGPAAERWPNIATLLDNRSQPGEMPQHSLRMRQNFWTPSEDDTRVRPGHTKFLSSANYWNADLHDQLLSLQNYYLTHTATGSTDQTIKTWPNAGCFGNLQNRPTGRQPVTLLFEAKTGSGNRKLIAGTESRIYALEEYGEDWRIIADGKGSGITDPICPARRFHASQNNGIVIFTNDYDGPVAWRIGGAPFGCSMNSVEDIPDLALIGLTRAKHTWVWRNVTFFADVMMDGIRYRNRILWSDYQNPLSWDPEKPESITGFKDLEYGEIFMGQVEVNDFLLIFTDRRIWQVGVVGGAATFDFHKRYTPERHGEGMLAYPNTLCSDGTTIFYAANEGVYKYDLYSPEPTRPEWIHRGSAVMFEDIASDWCDNTFGLYDPTRHEVVFFWVPAGSKDGFPESMLAIDVLHDKVHTVDVGATAALYYEPDAAPSLRDWFMQQCACSAADLAALGYGYIKEGLPKPNPPPPCAQWVGIHTSAPLTLYASTRAEITTEDFNGAVGANSFCAKLGDTRIEDICTACPADKKLVFASSLDWCLKEFSETNYSRESCSNPTAVGTTDASGYTPSVGQYAQTGYDSIARSGPQNFGSVGREKEISMFYVEIDPDEQTIPSSVSVRMGQSSQAVDPNTSGCGLRWWDEDSKLLACQTGTAKQMEEENLRADEDFRWPVSAIGRYLYWELKITGPGGSCKIGGIEQYIDVLSRRPNA